MIPHTNKKNPTPQQHPFQATWQSTPPLPAPDKLLTQPFAQKTIHSSSPKTRFNIHWSTENHKTL